MSNEKPSRIKRIITLVAGIAAFIGFRFVLGYSMLQSALLALAVYIVCRLVLRRFKKKPVDQMIADGVTASELDEILRDASHKLKEMRSYRFSIRDQAVQKRVDDIVEIGKKILKNIERSPADIKKSRQFLGYYIDTSLKIIKQYTELSGQDQSSETAQKTLRSAEEILLAIRTAFESHLRALLENDVMDLDTEIRVLKNMIKSDGLSEQ